ncbi:MAG TPA: FAD-dependent oxidoreductase, partial [Longimicrobium sp.]
MTAAPAFDAEALSCATVARYAGRWVQGVVRPSVDDDRPEPPAPWFIDGFAGADLQRAALRGATVQPAAVLAVQALDDAAGGRARVVLIEEDPGLIARLGEMLDGIGAGGRVRVSSDPASAEPGEILLVEAPFASHAHRLAQRVGGEAALVRLALHTRTPEVAWEGPLPGASSDAEPVARTEGGRTARVISIRPQLDLLSGDPTLSSIIEGARLRGDTRVRADVCVIGSGAGGAVAAARLAEAGHEVVLLEEGAFWRHGQFTEREGDLAHRLYADAGARATDDLAHPMLQGRAVGGGTTVNWLVMLRTPDWVLDEWAAAHGTVGMRPADLAPVFDRIEDETHTRVVPDDAHSPPNRLLLEGARALGWSASALKINAHGCVRSGFCGLGCRYGARRAAADVYVPAALAAGARLFADVRAERIELAERGGGAPLKRVHASILDRETGAARGRLTVEAPVVVLAGGAVGTPTLLQRSGMGGGGVGSFLRLHPTTSVFGRYDREMYGAAGIPLSAICDEFVRGSDGYGFWIETPPFYPSLSAAVVPGFGVAHRQVMEALPRLASMIVLVRDGADRARSSGSVTVDRNGRVRLRYRLGATDRSRLLRGMDAAARILFASGASEVSTLHTHAVRMRSPAELGAMAQRPAGPNQLGVLSAHVNGTCRMGTDPATSGCTPDGERHGVPGL